jgi:hypothetical protein
MLVEAERKRKADLLKAEMQAEEQRELELKMLMIA